MEKLPIESWNRSRVRAAEAMIRNMEAHMRLLEKQRDFLSVWKADKLRSLEIRVRELERQRDFLTHWKSGADSGLDSEGSHVDVQLQAGDGTRIHAHKAILAAKSAEFEILLRGEIKESTVDMPELSYEELQAFVKFFYTASVDSEVLVKHTAALLRAADRYKVEYLRSVCEEALVSNICKENAISMFVTAKKHCSEAILEAVLKKATGMGELSTFDEYKQYSQTDAGLLLELYEKLSELKKMKNSKKRHAGKETSLDGNYPTFEEAAKVSSAEHSGEIIGTNVTEAMNQKVDKEDGQGEDNGKTKEEQSKPDDQKKRVKNNDSPSRAPFDTSMMAGPPYGVPPFMPPFLPPYVSPMNTGNPMHPYFSGQRPPVMTAIEVPINRGKSSGVKKNAPAKRIAVPNKKNEEGNPVTPLPHGVTLAKGKSFRASILVNGITYILGASKTPEEAAHLYDRAAYVCGRETNSELSEKEKQELEGLLWEEFLGFPTESELEESKSDVRWQMISQRSYKYVKEELCFYQGVTKIPCNGGTQWWKARIGRQGKHFHLGTCKSREQAARLYDRASYLCGSKRANFDLSETERKELDETMWEDFVVTCRQTYKRRQFKRSTTRLPLPSLSLVQQLHSFY